MASCRFCLNNSVDTWFGNYCEKCHKLQRVIHLFTIDKVMSIIENVLIVDEIAILIENLYRTMNGKLSFKTLEQLRDAIMERNTRA